MKNTLKIGEIDAVGKCDNVPTWIMRGGYGGKRGYQGRRTWTLNSEFYKIAFTEGQRSFLENHSWRARPKPQHNPIVELFIDQSTLGPKDYTIMALLFL
jgi:hypothetical protein